MADNVLLNAGSGGETVATDQAVGGEHYQYVKLAYGADNTQTLVTAANGLTVQPDSGGFAVSATLDAETTKVIGTVNIAAGQTVAAVTDITNTVTVDNGGTFAVQAAVDELPAAAAASDDFANPTTTNILSMGMVWDGATWDRAPGNATDGLLVNLGTNNDISGTVTANAGTDLNTSALLTTTAYNDSFGTAGSADAQVRSVQGIASGTPMAVDATGQGDVPITLGGEAVVLGAGAALIGDVGVGVRTSGGTTLFKDIDVDETAAGSQVKGSAGQVYWIHAMNLSASTLYLKIYNQTSVTVGTTIPDLTFPLATQGDTNGAGFTLSVPNGIAFSTGIIIACTTGVADNDSGAPGANTCVVNIGYA